MTLKNESSFRARAIRICIILDQHGGRLFASTPEKETMQVMSCVVAISELLAVNLLDAGYDSRTSVVWR